MGYDAYLVGGAIRDTALGQTNVNDWDIALSVENVEELCDAIKLITSPDVRLQKFGLSHGVVSVKYENHFLTLSACREDLASIDGRHAKIKISNDWSADAKRRDFTCNALYFDGEKLWDPFGGLSHLAQRIVMFIGDPHKRLNEDILRFWRFFRFFSYVGGGQSINWEPYLPKLSILSYERTQQELRKLIKGPFHKGALHELTKIGVPGFVPYYNELISNIL